MALFVYKVLVRAINRNIHLYVQKDYRVLKKYRAYTKYIKRY